MTTIAEALQAAVQQHRAGNHAQAEHLYRQVLQLDPSHVDAWHLLGLCCHQSGRPQEAVDNIGRALQLRPDFPDAHYNLGNVLRDQGRLEDAVASYQRAVRLRPDRSEAHFNLGNTFRELKRFDEAVRCYQEALRYKPDYVKALINLGKTQQQKGQLEESAASYRHALSLQPRSARALGSLANVLRDQGKHPEALDHYRQALEIEPDEPETLNNYGVVLQRQGKLDEAFAVLHKALRLRPDYAEGHTNLGIAFRERGQLGEAISCFEKALALRPDLAAVRMNLGAVLREQGKPEEAEPHLREALRLDPALTEAHNNLGVTLLDLGRPEEALAAIEEARRRQPDSPETHANLATVYRALSRTEEALVSSREALRLKPDDVERWHGLAISLADAGRHDEALSVCCHALRVKPGHPASRIARGFLLLEKGDWEHGLREYEWRWKCGEIQLPPFVQPRWDGSPLEGRTLLLTAEQGLGDTMQFIRYAAQAKACGGTVVCHTPPALVRLLTTCPGIDVVVPQGKPLPPFDLYAPIMSLPGLFDTTTTTIPADIPYLFADPELQSSWRERLAKHPGLKVGVVWAGNPKFRLFLRRSLPLSALRPLMATRGISFFCLQKGPATADLATVGKDFGMIDLSESLNDFADTAALLAELDLLVCSDTGIAHLAGAMGVPTWVALSATPDWRWQVAKEESPWYPTVRLFRPDRMGDWEGVIRQMTAALEEVVAGKRPLTSRVAVVPPNRAAVHAPEPSEKSTEPPSKLDRGVSLARQGKLHQALTLFEEVIAENPQDAGAHMNRGILLAEQNRLDEAVASYRRALAIDPKHSGAMSNLGVVLGRQEKSEEALACYRQALAIDPEFAEGHVNIASLYHKKERWADAEVELTAALQLRPKMPEAHFSMGVGHARRGRLVEAAASLREALRWKPDHTDARLELANVLLDHGEPHEALMILRKALLLRPENGDLHSNHGIVSLLTEHFEEGWLDYEWRLHCQNRKPPVFPRPLWDGSPLEGRKILLHFEQGLGDTIHFARYAALVKARGGRVILGSPKPLVELLKTCPGVDRVAIEGEPIPVFDVHASLLTVPGILGTNLSNIPATVPYLTPDPVRRQRWRERLAASPGFRVGIVWRGNPTHPGDRRRSIPLSYFEPLAQIPGVQLVSLQKERGEAEMKELGDRLRLLDLSAELTDFSATAALVAELDLVIMCDTSVAHLAGALAKPVWVALPFAPDWRWLLEREDTPWYPTMRLFRQRRAGDWSDVFARLAEALRQRVEAGQ